MEQPSWHLEQTISTGSETGLKGHREGEVIYYNLVAEGASGHVSTCLGGSALCMLKSVVSRLYLSQVVGGETPGTSLLAFGASGLFLVPAMRDLPCLILDMLNYTIY